MILMLACPCSNIVASELDLNWMINKLMEALGNSNVRQIMINIIPGLGALDDNRYDICCGNLQNRIFVSTINEITLQLHRAN